MKHITEELFNILGVLDDQGCLLEEEHQRIDELAKEYYDKQKKLQRLEKLIATAASTAFAKDYCTDELFELYPEGTNPEEVWKELDEAFFEIFNVERKDLLI